MNKIILILTALTIPLAVKATTAEDVKAKTSEAMTTTSNYTKEQKDKFQADMKKNLESIKKDLAEMKREASKKSTAVKKDMKEEIAKLEKKEGEMKQSMVRLEHSSGQAWDEMKDGMSKSWDDLSTSYQAAKEKYKDKK